MSVRVEMRWPGELVEAVDGVRGDVPRATWVKRAVEKALGGAYRPDLSGGRKEPQATAAQVDNAPAPSPEFRGQLERLGLRTGRQLLEESSEPVFDGEPDGGWL